MMFTLGARNKFVRNWKSIFVNFIGKNNKQKNKKNNNLIFPCWHKSCSSISISISWIISICAKFYSCKIFEIWLSAKVKCLWNAKVLCLGWSTKVSLCESFYFWSRQSRNLLCCFISCCCCCFDINIIIFFICLRDCWQISLLTLNKFKQI